MNSKLIEDFQTYANSFRQGYLKNWKASTILYQLGQDDKVMDDEVRFLTFLKNCLEMEGFRSADIELIMGWLYERKEEIAA